MFTCYMDAYTEFLKDLVSSGDCGSERVKEPVATEYIFRNGPTIQRRGLTRQQLISVSERHFCLLALSKHFA